MIQIIVKMARNILVSHLFSMKYIFLEMNTASLSTQKKEWKKNLDLNNHLGDTKFNE